MEPRRAPLQFGRVTFCYHLSKFLPLHGLEEEGLLLFWVVVIGGGVIALNCLCLYFPQWPKQECEVFLYCSPGCWLVAGGSSAPSESDAH